MFLRSSQACSPEVCCRMLPAAAHHHHKLRPHMEEDCETVNTKQESWIGTRRAKAPGALVHSKPNSGQSFVGQSFVVRLLQAQRLCSMSALSSCSQLPLEQCSMLAATTSSQWRFTRHQGPHIHPDSWQLRLTHC